MNMKKTLFATLIFTLLLTFQSFIIIIRDDVNDSKYIELGGKYSDIICHFPMGEGTLIDSSWVITAGHVGKDLKRDLQNGNSVTVKINGTEYQIDDVFVNPDFQPIVNDLA
jgi:Trypsin